MARWQYQQKVEPIAGGASVTGSADAVAPSDNGSVENPLLLQYQSVVGPVFIPSEVVPDTVTARGKQGGLYIGGIKRLQYVSVTGPLVVLQQAQTAVDPALLSWRPSMPDFARRVDIEAAQHQALTWRPLTPTGFVDGDRRWNAFVPPFAHKAKIHPARIPFLTWNPNTPTSVSIFGGGVSDGSVIEKEIRIQYQAITGPVFVATAPVVFTGPFNFSVPQLPVGLTAAYGPHFFAGGIQQMEMDWLPKHPDRIWKRGRRAQYAPYFGGFGVPGEVVIHATINPVAPSFIHRNRLHAALMPFREFGPDPQIEIDRQAQSVNISMWKGWYPDRIDGRKIHASGIPFFTGQTSVSIFPIPELSWKGFQPDLIWRQRFHPALQDTEPVPFSTQGAVPPIFFGTTFPTVIGRPKYHPAYNKAEISVRFIDPVPELSWKSEYPDSIIRPKLHVSKVSGFMDVLYPNLPVVQGWDLSVHPDRIDRPIFHAMLQQAFTTGPEQGAPAPELSWKSIFPDWIERRFLHPSKMQDSGRGFPSDTSTFAWRSSYPDFIVRQSILAAQQQVLAIGSYGTISIPELSWKPEYPDWLLHRRATFTNSPINLEPIPNPPAPDLSWGPSYPDYINRLAVHPARLPFAWWNVTTPDRVPFEWVAQHPHRIAQRPKPTQLDIFRGYEVSSVAPEAWRGSQPDRIHRRTLLPGQRPSLFQPEPSTFPSISAFASWRPDFPDRIWTLDRPPSYQPWFITDPTIIGGAIDCIEIKDGELTYPMLAATAVTLPALIDESLTISTPEGEEYC